MNCMKILTINKIDQIIEILESTERVSEKSEYYKKYAILYLKNYADPLEGERKKSVRIIGEKNEQRS